MTFLLNRRSTKEKLMLTNTHRQHPRWTRHVLAAVVALGVVAVPIAAQAQRKSPLADAPAIRKRYELRASRFEVGAGFGSTLNQDFFHTLMFNVKIAFHINDWLSIAGFGGFAVDNIATSFQGDLINSLSDTQNATVTREPTKTAALASLQKINSVYGLQLEFSPFTGKYSLFGKLFANYDFYAFAGPGFINVKTAGTVDACASQPSTGDPFSCGVTGTKVGFNFGLGFHSYFNNFVGLNVELRDILAQLDPSGRDTNGDETATTADVTFSHTYMVAANIVFMLPPNPSVSP